MMKQLKERNGNSIEAITKKFTKGAMKREKYIDKLTRQLKEWDKELTELEKKAGDKYTDLKSKFAQRMDQTKKKRDELRKKLNRLEKAGEEVSKDLKNDFEILWKDIKDGIANMRKQLK
ncbi:MAG TPA: hypothetical protein VJ905_08705 [Halalkalibaculum sp.]|nr:hypothetical protein [Halalkalibaculum sp.]